MKMSIMAMAGVLMPAAVLAGPVVKIDPVAEGFPDWQGMSAKSFIMGREIGPSDLRHKVTIVVMVEPNEKLEGQLVLASKLVQRTGMSSGIGFGSNWEDAELPRNVIAVVSVLNCRSHEAIQTLLKPTKGRAQDVSSAISTMNGNGCSFYENLTFTGAPDNGGKLPYVYIMGPTGTDPLYKGELNAAGVKEGLDAIAKGKKEIDGWETKWRPFFGNIAEPKFNTSLAKVLEKGKTAKLAPLAPVTKGLLSDIKSKDAEKSKEAQILFDAINQTRSDLVLRIQMEASACPHRALYDIETLLKFWPAEKKRLEAAYNKIKANPEAEPLAKIFCKLMEWSKPEFTCKNAAEAKKITQDLNKMKKTLEKLKESKNITIQNGALLVDMKIDELISSIPSKVPSK